MPPIGIWLMLVDTPPIGIWDMLVDTSAHWLTNVLLEKVLWIDVMRLPVILSHPVRNLVSLIEFNK